MVAVPVRSGAALELGEPNVLFRFPSDLLQQQSQVYTPWDIAPDGRFIMARSVTAATQIEAADRSGELV